MNLDHLIYVAFRKPISYQCYPNTGIIGNKRGHHHNPTAEVARTKKRGRLHSQRVLDNFKWSTKNTLFYAYRYVTCVRPFIVVFLDQPKAKVLQISATAFDSCKCQVATKKWSLKHHPPPPLSICSSLSLSSSSLTLHRLLLPYQLKLCPQNPAT